MLNTIMEKEFTNFANILIPFLGSCSQHFNLYFNMPNAVNMISEKGLEY